ncbi:MAG TPA: DUF262 domain-containing protein [Chloroflexi bacterium]|jgi:hypothetical protein|nr:DUF262 domain-containing protein [Chloroflexota bacterium]
MQLSTILDQIDLGTYALPEFQRGYVWTREQVRKLMVSLYKGYPIGSLLIWVTRTDKADVRGDSSAPPGTVNLILDGQQRITSLYGIIKGKPPQFFDGNANAFTGLYFSLKDETFEFYMAAKMKEDPNWISVTDLFREDLGIYIANLMPLFPNQSELTSVINKLNRIVKIKSIEFHIHQVSGDDKTVDVVVDIFNNVNSGGTKLSKGDLALAKICARWPEARAEMKQILRRLKKAGYSFELEWLLRCVTIYATGKAYYTELDSIDTEVFQNSLSEASKLIDVILNHIGSRLGLDHDRVLGSRYSIPLMVGYIKKVGLKNLDSPGWNKLMYWYIHTFLWGRYAGSTESVLSQDLNIIESGEGVGGLIRQLRQNRGDLQVRPEDFWGWSIGARFYPLLYMMTRVAHAKDWCSGLELSNMLLGKQSTLEVHHIFPKAQLYKSGYTKSEVNALANYSFLTKSCNLEISNRKPEEYLPVYIQKNPGAISSHWIPENPELYAIDRYPDFLAQRRILLAEHANEFLDSLLVSESGVDIEDYAHRAMDEVQPSDVSVEKEEEAILSTSIWMEELGLNPGIMNYELLDNQDELMTVVDLAWPEGIQTGLSEPVALLLNEPIATHNLMNEQGYRYFTDLGKFRKYVHEHIEAL